MLIRFFLGSRQNRHALLFFVLICLCNIPALAENREIRLVQAGLELFPGVLSADMDIHKKLGHDKKLLLLLVHKNHPVEAAELAEKLLTVGSIRSIGMRVEVLSSDALTNDTWRHPAGIFLVQAMDDKLSAILQYAGKHQALVFSPFEEEVRRGVPAGLFIRNKIKPYINMRALRTFNVRLKPFFLRIATIYDE